MTCDLLGSEYMLALFKLKDDIECVCEYMLALIQNYHKIKINKFHTKTQTQDLR